MRSSSLTRLALILGLVLMPTTAMAAELDELLDESQDASYTAEQLITCDTPDGVRDVLIELEQQGGEIRYGSRGDDDSLSWSGHGGWSSPSGGSKIEADSTLAAADPSTGSYVVGDGSATEYLGRQATRYVLNSGSTTRAELVVDDELGVFLSVTTFAADGETYCERRFVSFDPTPPEWEETPATESQTIDHSTDPHLPVRLGDFDLIDVFADDTGLSFAYYSDGFFSFAVFESPVPIEAADPTSYRTADGVYQRQFSPGQVTYTWTVGSRGMALIGDLPPDMHDAILAELDHPRGPGFFNRLWRSIFG